MEAERAIARYRRWYRRLLRCYPRRHHERFGHSMEQTFNDLCRERAAAGKGLFGFVLWMFMETCSGVICENAATWKRFTMSQHALTVIKYGAIALGVLMLAGIATVMFLARGTGEDITGIVAPALLITLGSVVVVTVTAILQRREQRRSSNPR